MERLSTDRIRNVVLVGHTSVGKTTLAEALLARAGAIGRAGRVDDGTSMLDTEPEEQKRTMSLSLALAPFDWKASDGITYHVNLIDTPGYADLVGEVEAALSVCDLALFVVSGVDGVEVGTEVAWQRCKELGIPRMVFVSKEDKERANYSNVLDQLSARFGPGFITLELPLGEESSLHGVADVLTEQAFEYEADGRHHVEPLPDDIADEEHLVHEMVVEEIVSGDDEQLERYLSGDMPTLADLERTLANEVLACVEFPVMLGSATTGVGIDRLADFICELGPSPAARPTRVTAGDQRVEVTANPDGEPLALVFKTVADPFVGQLSIFKVLSGTIRPDDHLRNSRTGSDERLHNLFVLRGKDQSPAPTLVAGDIGAVAKLGDTRTGDTLAPKGSPVVADAPLVPHAVYGVAVVPRTQADDDKLISSISKLQTEDRSLVVERNEDTHQTVLWGLGDTHLTVTIERLQRKFGVGIDTEDLRVPYRETIQQPTESEGKVKKQSGGHGQYAVVNLRVSPLGRGEGFRFVDSIVGGAVPRNYLPAVQKGLEETMAHGGVNGFPVVDVQVECYDGKYHAVDSSEMAFKTAAGQGLREALNQAGVLVLEPISLVTVTVPSEVQGDVLGDINARRGRVQSSEVVDRGEQQITALVPSAEIIRYAVDLRSMTAGRGRFHAAHNHYDVLPPHLVDAARSRT